MSAPALEKKPGGASLTEGHGGNASNASPGKRSLAEQLPPMATYTVRPGESLTVIAAKLRTSVDALKAANGAKLKTFPGKHGPVQCFTAGDVITVPTVAAATAEPEAPAPAATAEPEAPAPEPGMFDNLLDRVSGTAHRLWDKLTGSAANDPHAAGPHADGKADAHPDTHPDARADAQPDAKAEPHTDAPFADLTTTARGAKLSTYQPDEIGALDKFGDSATGRAAAKKRGQWLSGTAIRAAGNKKSGDAYVESVDDLVGKTKFTEDQQQIITSAKEFAANPKPLTPAQEANAVMDWSKAQTTLDGVSLNADLKARLERYVRFLAWANLITAPTEIGSVMRSPATAHKLAVGWMFNLETNNSDSTSLKKPANRQKLVATVTANGGTDKDGTEWMSETVVAGLKDKKDDDDALWDYIKTTVAPAANKIQHQKAVAAEGYKTADKRHPNINPGTFISNHLLGEAVDMTLAIIFSNKFDPVIDAIALYFGVWRAVKDDHSSPESWHYERIGSPPGAEHDDH